MCVELETVRHLAESAAAHTMISGVLPEVHMHCRCGPEADIFAFANVLWELVTQEMPIREAFRSREAVCPAECPAPIKDLIHRCRDADPMSRPTANEVSVLLLHHMHCILCACAG